MSATVSIILCSYNRADHLEKTLQSLRQVEVPKDWDVELILVDNASTDTTPGIMQSFDHPHMSLKVVCEKKEGLSSARNRGIQEAKGQVLLFTDDDVRFPPNWIKGMASPILCGKTDAVAGGVELSEKVREDWMTPHYRELLASTERIDPDQPERMVGANMAIAKKVFEEVPKFDPELGAGQLGCGEETLFSWQMQEAGFQIESAFGVVVEHRPDTTRFSREEFCEMAKKRGKSAAHINYHWRHHTDWNPVFLLAGLVFFGIKIAWWRLRHVQFIADAEGHSMEEFELLRRFYRIQQHLVEQRREPKYPSQNFTV